jgi:hypothetical protein
LTEDGIEAADPVDAVDEDAFSDLRGAKYWLGLIAEGEKAFQLYHEKCDNIEKLYANLEQMAKTSSETEMKVFWANLEVLKPAIYARPPVPVVTPRFRRRDKKARAAADVIERALLASYDIEKLNKRLKMVRNDLAVCGRGAIWVRYDVDAQGLERVAYEHVDRRDFLHDPAREWAEVKWVAKRSFLNDRAGKQRFGEEWDRVRKEERKGESYGDGKGEKTGEVWEIWHREEGAVAWVSPHQDAAGDVLDIQPPPFDLAGFFPCPEPAYSTVEPHTLRPVPDFVFYRDQLDEINALTNRITALSDALKLKGFYAAGNGDVADAIETAMKAVGDNAVMVPVPNMQAMGGSSLKESIIWLPVETVALTIRELIALRKQIIDDVYQITGISDIMRGTTVATETLGAQQLKSQYGNVRIKDRQEEMIRICLEITEIAAEIMAENFSPEALKMYSQVDDLPDRAQIQQQAMQIQQQVQAAQANPQVMAMAQQNPEQAQQILQQAQAQLKELEETVTFDDVMDILKAERTRPFVLDIETNSTVQPDEQADKQARAEALTAIAGFIGQAAPLVKAEPSTGPFVAETLKWLAQGFRMGRPMDSAIDEFSEQIAAFAKQPKPPGPEQMMVEAEKEKIKIDAEKHKAEMALKNDELTLKKDQMAYERRTRAGEKLVDMLGAGEERDRDDGKAKKDGTRLDGIETTLAALVDAVAEMRQSLTGSPTVQ